MTKFGTDQHPTVFNMNRLKLSLSTASSSSKEENHKPFFKSSEKGTQEYTNTFFQPSIQTKPLTQTNNQEEWPYAFQNDQYKSNSILPFSTYTNCTQSQEKTIKSSISQAQVLVKNAINRLPKGDPNLYKKHFGNADPKKVKARYEQIAQNLGNHQFICDECSPESLVPYEVTDQIKAHRPNLCGLAPCPGKKIILCPPFFSSAQTEKDKKKENKKEDNKSKGDLIPCPTAATIIHEAAHNEGACLDISPCNNHYPGTNPYDNAYSYEMYAANSHISCP